MNIEPMNLLLTITSLEPGTAITFTVEDANRMARMDCESLLWDRPDPTAFLKKLSHTHGLHVTSNLNGTVTAYRPEAR